MSRGDFWIEDYRGFGFKQLGSVPPVLHRIALSVTVAFPTEYLPCPFPVRHFLMVDMRLRVELRYRSPLVLENTLPQNQEGFGT
jgi:hypothetical protein